MRLTEEQRELVLCNRVTHELCRLAIDRKRAPGEANVAVGRAPVTVFLSHSRRDQGKMIAEEIRDYMAANMQMKNFFDAVDIPPGSSWAAVLDAASSNVAMLSIMTDTYASVPWCQRELLNARRSGIPLRIIYALTEGAPRSMPDMGNVPIQPWRPDDPFRFENALGTLLIQALEHAYKKARIERLKRLYGVPDDQLTLSTSPDPQIH